MIGCYKIPTRISHHRYLELFESLNDVFAEASLIREGIARVVDAAIYAAAHVPGAWLVSRGAKRK